MVKNLLAVWQTWVRFLGWEDPLEKGMTTHTSILAEPSVDYKEVQILLETRFDFITLLFI